LCPCRVGKAGWSGAVWLVRAIQPQREHCCMSLSVSASSSPLAQSDPRSAASLRRPKLNAWIASTLWGLGGLLAGVVLWYLATARASSFLMQQFGPAASFHSLLEILVRSETWMQVGTRLQRIFVGLAISLGVGVPAALLLGLSARAHDALAPLFQF